MTETPEEKAARLTEWHRIPSQDEIDAAVEAARRPALLLNKMKFPDEPGEPGCWLGGAPTLPPECEWPHHQIADRQIPLHFIAQINLATVPRRDGFPDVPASGTLFFFLDPLFVAASGRVIYHQGDVSAFAPRVMPEFPDVSDEAFWGHDDCSYVAAEWEPPLRERLSRQWNFDWLDFNTFFFDRYRNKQIMIIIKSAQHENSVSFLDLAKKKWTRSEPGSAHYIPLHYLFGCQQEMLPPKGPVRLLLAIRDDEDIGITGGTYYLFWIHQEALAAREFHKAFVTNN